MRSMNKIMQYMLNKIKTMLCPFCLKKATFKRSNPEGAFATIYSCPHCGEHMPALYVREYWQYPPVIVNAVGFRQHGKTLYFASLFYILKKLSLAQQWPEFFTMGLNEDSLDTVYGNVAMLERGKLPDSTPKNFPRPTIVRTHGIPLYPNRTLLCFDTGGECFERPTQLIQFASFVRRARTVLFLVSLVDMKDPGPEMFKLLNTYVVGMGELDAHTRDQDLVVIYTKADALNNLLAGREGVRNYLAHGDFEEIANQDHYVKQMYTVSHHLYGFTRNTLKAYEFLNAVKANFRRVMFSMISSLGSAPQGDRLPVEIVPRRVMDPLLWTMEESIPRWKQLWQWWQR